LIRGVSLARQYRGDSAVGSGIATLMADAGLTNGAFYANFASKDDLVATAVADQRASFSGRLSPARRSRAARA
jgi:TetR/AcrR family transcriptional regulator, transcriptional repressor for nem operon